jgi:phosphatidate cytidylyltransferase
MNELLKRTLSGIVFAAIVIGFIYSGALGLLIICLVLNIVGLREFLQLRGYRDTKDPLFYFLLIMISILSLLHFSSPFRVMESQKTAALAIPAILALVYILVALWKKGLDSYTSIADGAFALVYINLPLILFQQFAQQDGYSWQRAMLPLLLVWSSDTFAYLSGRWLGKTPLYPSLSPKKTIEGFIGGTVLTAALGAVLCYVWDLSGPVSGLILGLAVSTFGTAGDLFESALKRNAGVKDSGNLIPGHGGVLDRFDAFFFVCVVVWIWNHIGL